MKDSSVHLPSRSRLKPIRTRVIQNAVIAFVPILQASHDVILRRSRLQSKKRVREIVLHDVVLRREVIRLRLAALADFLSEFIALVHVMRDRTKVVEKLAQDIPSAFS